MELTNREKEVIGYLCEGLSDREIAAKMFVTVSAVKFHIHNSLAKLNLKNRTQLALLFKELKK